MVGGVTEGVVVGGGIPVDNGEHNPEQVCVGVQNPPLGQGASLPTLQAVTPGAVGEYLHIPLQGCANVPVHNCVEVQVEAVPQGLLSPTVHSVKGGVLIDVVQPPPQLAVFTCRLSFLSIRIEVEGRSSYRLTSKT